jgi:intracellular sulfur oxidation DsrE/DsrF family protein
MTMTAIRFTILAAAGALLASAAGAQDMSAFRTGPIFEEFGAHAPVEGVGTFAPDTEFAIAFDVADQAKAGTRNRGFESAARFINMHASHAVDPANMRIAVVVHGGAVKDLLDAEENGSRAMVTQLLDYGVRFIVCGQSAAVHGVAETDLIPGAELALSAMTAHAQLQQAGYTVNPF